MDTTNTIQRIVTFLRSKREDCSTIDIAATLSIDRHTAAKHLEVMHSKGLVEYRPVGKSKLWKISKSGFITALKNDTAIGKHMQQILSAVDEHISIQNTDFHVLWNNKNTDHTMHKCHEAYAQRNTKCKNCPVQRTFLTGKESSTVMNGWPKQGKVLITAKPLKNEFNDTIAVVEIVKKIRS